MNAILILIAISLISCETDQESLIFQNFQKFIKKYNKHYSSMNEYLSRYQVFKMNFMETSLKSSSSYKAGITKFSDLTFQEFSKIYLNLDYNFMAFQNYETIDIKIPMEFLILMIGEKMVVYQK